MVTEPPSPTFGGLERENDLKKQSEETSVPIDEIIMPEGLNEKREKARGKISSLNLENLVPPMRLCQQVKDYFENSELVWWADYNGVEIIVIPRKLVPHDYEIFAPAPTLQEILAVIPPDALADFYINATDSGYKVDMIANNRSTTIANGDNPVTAALNVWIELNKKGEQ